MSDATIALPSNTGQLQPRKLRKSTKPQSVQNAILIKAAQALNKSQIAEDLGITRPTVSNILSQSEIGQHIAEMRSDMVQAGDLRTSVKVIRSKLAKESESAALAILRGFNVLQSGNQMTVNVQNNGAMTWLQVRKAEVEEQTTTNSVPTLNKP